MNPLDYLRVSDRGICGSIPEGRLNTDTLIRSLRTTFAITKTTTNVNINIIINIIADAVKAPSDLRDLMINLALVHLY